MKEKIKKIFSMFIKKTKTTTKANIILLIGFFSLLVSSFVIFSFTRESTIETLSQFISEISRKSKSGTTNLSFIEKEEVNKEEFQRLTSYSYSSNLANTDVNYYDMRVTVNSAKEGTKLQLEGLGNNYVGIYCYYMGFREENSSFIHEQIGLHLEFPRKGSVKSDFKEGTTNFIYIRESDANKLISTPGTEYYGLTHEQLLGKGIDVELSYRGNVVTDKWKIDNILLENVDNKRDGIDKHLCDLYGDYFLSCIYGNPLLQGFSVQMELALSETSNSRSIKKGINNFTADRYYPCITSSVDSQMVSKANNLLLELMNKKNNDIPIIIAFAVICFLFESIVYITLGKIKSFRAPNVFFMTASFTLIYFFFFVARKISPIVFGGFFSTFGILFAFILTVLSISMVFISKMNEPQTYPKISLTKDDLEAENEND